MIEHHIGRDLPRIELEGYGFGLATGGGEPPRPTAKQAQKEARVTRGRRMGSRAGKELTPEELQKLLAVG